MLRSYQKQCEKSDLWSGLTDYLAYLDNDEGSMMVTTQINAGYSISRSQKCKLSENPEAHKTTIGGYIYDMKCNGKSNLRLDELGYFSGIPNLDPQLKWENALTITLDLIREESKTTDVDAKLTLWKRIADRLIDLEDLVSYSLLKRKLQGIQFTLKEDGFNSLAEMRAALQDPILTRCLSARRLDTLCGFFPEINTIVFADPNSFPFVTKKFTENYLKLTGKDVGSIFKFYQPAVKTEQPSLPEESTTRRVPARLGEFGGLH